MNAAKDDSPENKASSCLMDLLSFDNQQAGKLYCIQCRQHLCSPSSSRDGTTTTEDDTDTPPPALRCSRCQIVHYCSRKCQKANYSLHKSMCKNIQIRRSTSSSTLGSASWNDKFRRFELASSIVGLAYLSTDTIDRARQIFHLALLEYYKLLELDFHYVGALESTLMLLSILGYDDHLCGLIDFVFYRLEHHPKERITITNNNNGKDDDLRLLYWAQGMNPPERKELASDLGRINLLKGQQWCANNFLVPLLFWNMKRMNSAVKQSRKDNICVSGLLMYYRKISADLGTAIEEQQCGNLPVLWALFPDSNQRWQKDEASELFALARMPPDNDQESLHTAGSVILPETGHWDEACILFWDILKDAIAFHPLTDSLEDTITAMDDYLNVSAISELDPQDLADFEAWKASDMRAEAAMRAEGSSE
jgi:hypothetical protein